MQATTAVPRFNMERGFILMEDEDVVIEEFIGPPTKAEWELEEYISGMGDLPF